MIQHRKNAVIRMTEPGLIDDSLVVEQCVRPSISNIHAAARRRWSSYSAQNAREPTSNAIQSTNNRAKIRPTTVQDTWSSQMRR
ncbi:hypothetical protein LX36DRAFT_482458 [Colletotrichum falcatum]|nr:hypothetical protein LX36DRAFT_482458 [Colletotrichum falcatum]